jgi:Lamin Tail Domain
MDDNCNGVVDEPACVTPSGDQPIKINEVQTAGGLVITDDKEFVELFNSSGDSQALVGWTLVYRSASGSTDSVLYTFGPGSEIPAGGYLVLGGGDYTGPEFGHMSHNLSDSAGGIGLRNATGVLIDAVAYGASTNALTEGSPAQAPPRGQSIARLPNGFDSDNNAEDFEISIGPTPGALNMY